LLAPDPAVQRGDGQGLTGPATASNADIGQTTGPATVPQQVTDNSLKWVPAVVGGYEPAEATNQGTNGANTESVQHHGRPMQSKACSGGTLGGNDLKDGKQVAESVAAGRRRVWKRPTAVALRIIRPRKTKILMTFQTASLG
jgi:hypothetical protein